MTMAAKKKNSSIDLASQADPRAPLDGALLLSKAQGLLAELEADLLARARGSAAVREALRARHEAERAARRTADPLEVWERHFVTQVAASWLLSCVFVRTLEDRGLLGHNRIAGPGALDSQRLFFELAPSLTEREYLLTIFRELSRLPAARDLFDARHNPVWMLGPSAEMAKKLVALFRTPNADAPGLRFGQADTRFLGDLYQDLSDAVRERFALLQTPHFVETYILDRTLERAIARFGLDETTLIDPTCGSGHFLLGAFERLVDHRLRKEPGLDVREAARKALDAVYGADINPYAVAIARFRLTLAFLDKAGYARLADAPALPLHLVVADSLLHNPQHAQAKLGEVAGQSMKDWGGDEFALEDEAAARDVLHRRFAAVVGNPPYITPKDAVLAQEYRKLYPSSAAKQYSLGAPFAERFFQLARSAGCVGMITANSFMKREFGKKLIEEFLPRVNLDGVVNTSGAYIPGHGTPTVLLFGTNEAKLGDDVLSVLSKRGEPSTPADPEHGLVWRSIADHGSEVGFENDYISVARVPRWTLERHPWSLGGGGATELKALLEERAHVTLAELVDAIGRTNVVGEDEVWIADRASLERRGLGAVSVPFVIGEAVRDWAIVDPPFAVYPYESIGGPTLPPTHPALRSLWPWRALLERRTVFKKQMKEHGRPWWEHLEHYRDKLQTPLSIAFAFVATHNHFVLDRGGKVFNRSAPIIKLKEGATEEDHLALLAYLNSSTACFWMKQVFYPKASGVGDVSIEKGRPEANRYEFAGTQMAALPIPPLGEDDRATLIDLAMRLTSLAEQREQQSARRVLDEVHAGRLVQDAMLVVEEMRRRFLAEMRALQEDIDWCVYRAYGLAPSFSRSTSADAGLRPFEATADPIRVCDEWQQRVKWIQDEPNLRLIEDPLSKRLWEGRRGVFGHNVMSLDDEVRDASAEWLAERGEVVLRSRAEPAALRSLLRDLEMDMADARVLSVAIERGRSLAESVARDAVPFLAAYRHTESGLEKRAEWERVWDLQRAEDRGENVAPFDPAPKYDQKDYRDATSWRLRGKLDVPKERFISYPGCESDEDKEPVYGWAGWNHLQQAQALAALYQKRKTEENWGKERLTPMLAGLLELIPWVKQWHNEPNAEFGGLRLGDYFETFLDSECHAQGLTREDLRAFRPATKSRSKPGKAAPPNDAENPDPAPKVRRAKGAKKKAAQEAKEGGE